MSKIAPVYLGGLSVGNVPRVVGTVCSMASLRDAAARHHCDCDIVEARLDEIGVQGPWLEHCGAIEQSGTPVILTLRATIEGGKCDLPDHQRLALLRRGIEHISVFDVELSSGLAPALHDLAQQKSKSLIVSFHDFQRTPPLADLEQIVARALPHASVVKVSTMIANAEDIRTLQQLLQTDRGVPLCVIGMGLAGAGTRTAFPALGSCLTYGYIDRPAAPGQLSALALVEHLRANLPAYNEDWTHRHKPGRAHSAA